MFDKSKIDETTASNVGACQHIIFDLIYRDLTGFKNL
jgi:hypothetical protein